METKREFYLRGYKEGKDNTINKALEYCNSNNEDKEECWCCCLSVWKDGQFSGCYLEELKC